MIDPYKLAQLPRDKPIRLRTFTREDGTCVLCDGPLGDGAWYAPLPDRAGPAHSHCAADAGWKVH